ncbi:MAG: L,D-transpeptidase [Scytonema sp. PMC 1069.18]|nr:L,D-transpeptidase [Scytonema sp. PMC 1069.18]MEC4886898.1 L,D-transpeptidase [Scytonema sp. PMC 1070.18]
MAMVRNDSLTRVVMLLCFGTAILSLVVHWRVTTSVTPETELGKNENTSRQALIAKKPKQMLQGDKQSTATYNPLSLLTAYASTRQNSQLGFGKNQVLVDLSDRRVYVYRGETVIASYPIGIGKKGWETPTGSFQVLNKQHNPIWQHPITGKIFPSGTDSPLGDRWIGFWTDGRNQIGFHGTPDDDLVGAAISHGCLRMRNPDVRLLYKQVGLGTTVEVQE